jgi:hypothetical protein
MVAFKRRSNEKRVAMLSGQRGYFVCSRLRIAGIGAATIAVEGGQRQAATCA